MLDREGLQILPNKTIAGDNVFDLPDKVAQRGTAASHIVAEIVEEPLESSERMIQSPSFIWREWDEAKLICKELEFKVAGTKLMV